MHEELKFLQFYANTALLPEDNEFFAKIKVNVQNFLFAIDLKYFWSVINIR